VRIVFVLGVLVLVAAPTAAAKPPPPPPPKFWTVDRCEQLFARDHGVTNAQGYGFHLGLTICVGTGGPQACTGVSGRRLYSQFTVFTRSRFIGGVVRSFTLATRAGPGLARIGPRQRGRPAEFYYSPTSVRMLAPDATPARFRTIVAPLAAELTHEENATRCST
jgi:hypothetical protein